MLFPHPSYHDSLIGLMSKKGDGSVVQKPSGLCKPQHLSVINQGQEKLTETPHPGKPPRGAAGCQTGMWLQPQALLEVLGWIHGISIEKGH